ncbi:hypothetical protein D3C85_384810 [compost metagenome]
MNNLGDLLATLNGDGGHSVDDLGIEKSIELALENTDKLKQQLAESYSLADIEDAIYRVKQGMFDIAAHDRKSYVGFAECALDGLLSELSN